jgi:hypothetical protein
VGGVELASFAPTTLAILVAAVLATAGCVALVERAITSLAAIVFRRGPTARSTASIELGPAHAAHRARPRPLTIHGGLRAPPLFV